MKDSTSARCAIVTGSSRGIGLAIARHLAHAGMNVVLNSSGKKSLPAARQEAEQLQLKEGVRALAVAADVSSTAEAKSLVDEALAEFGRVDVLVNNAGITRDALIARMSEDDFDDVLSVNLKGTFNCCKAVVRPMMRQRHGRIVSLSSVVGISGNAGQSNYAASKAGVIGLTKALAKELGPRNITVNAIAPGFISTDMTEQLSKERQEAIASRIACGRFGSADDVAHAVGFLAGDQAGYVTGQVLSVDGGLSL